jgi:hypothetical protein
MVAVDRYGCRYLGRDRVWPTRVAARKRHRFIGYFLLSLLFFPLPLIVAYVCPTDVQLCTDHARGRPAT